MSRQRGAHSRPRFQSNPAWVTTALAGAYEILETKIPADFLPKLTEVGSRGDEIFGEVKEYGCGAYGCVYPTHDPSVVLKVTTDETEAEFAATLANELVAPICVEYRMVVGLAARHENRPINLLWRESAQAVGNIGKVLGDEAEYYITEQHAAAERAFKAAYKYREAQGRQVSSGSLAFFERDLVEALEGWLGTLETIAAQEEVPALRELGAGMLQIWHEQRVLFGDIHPGNLGLVEREDGEHWVITDPGNIAVLSDLTAIPNPAPYPGYDPDGTFVWVVMDAARKVASGAGRHKALIADVWDQIVRDDRADDMTYPEFQRELARLHKSGKLVLSRADLPSVWGAARVAKSDIDLGGSIVSLVNL